MNLARTTLTFVLGGLGSDLPQDSARTQVLREMALDWDRGARTPAEKWLERHPELAADAQSAVQIVYEEVCLREERGETVQSDEIYRRFPQWSDSLHMLFDCHRMVQSEFPNPHSRTRGKG